MQTPLHSIHVALGAKMINFNGWEMPLSYQGILAEHSAVRERAGIFDLSHMGKIEITGPEAEAFLDFLSTNHIKGKSNNSATYTVWMNERGGSVDDLIVYKQSEDAFFVIVNASNREKDLEHIKNQAKGWNVHVNPHYQGEGILAIQGPQSIGLVHQLFPDIERLKPMQFVNLTYEGDPVILSTTGYTGSGGVEIFTSSRNTQKIWDYFVNQQKVPPIGLGARDTLRLEMGYALYGHELSDTIAPTESVSAWTVKMDKENFLGKEQLIKLENSGRKRFSYGILLQEEGIAREGAAVVFQEKEIGKVTSGTFAPSLHQAVALILVNQPLKTEDEIKVLVRNRPIAARIVKLPFINPGKTK